MTENAASTSDEWQAVSRYQETLREVVCLQAYDDLLSGRNNIKEELKDPSSSKPKVGCVERDPQLRTALQNYNW